MTPRGELKSSHSVALEKDRGDAVINDVAGTVVTDPVTLSGLKNCIVNVLGASHDRTIDTIWDTGT